MADDLKTIQDTALTAIKAAKTLDDLQALRVQTLGKKGTVTALLKSLGKLSAEERPAHGQKINALKGVLQEALAAQEALLSHAALEATLAAEKCDVTLPGRQPDIGGLHPVTKTCDRIVNIFQSMGFSVVEGPEIESEYYNFEALNIPEHHPARASHDTFYMGEGHLLRTHTSPVQIRAMQANPGPLRLIAPGRVYRCDSDVTHAPMFHQIEGLLIDKDITFAHLKGCLTEFLQAFFEKELPVRFRASFFPFTEPSAEVDMACPSCENQKGCRVCSHSGWLEVLGSGMVHPNVIRAGGLDPEVYNGFAFGMGIDRMAMLRYGIYDLRRFFENDWRFLTAYQSGT